MSASWVVIFGGLIALVVLAWDLDRTRKARARTINQHAQVAGSLYLPRYYNGY